MKTLFLLAILFSAQTFAETAKQLNLNVPQNLVPVRSVSQFMVLRGQMGYSPLKAYYFGKSGLSGEYLYVDTKHSSVSQQFDSQQMGFFYFNGEGAITELHAVDKVEVPTDRWQTTSQASQYVVRFPEIDAVARLRFFTASSWDQPSSFIIRGQKFSLHEFGMNSFNLIQAVRLSSCRIEMAQGKRD